MKILKHQKDYKLHKNNSATSTWS